MVHIAYDPIYAHPLPDGHRFPMLKYELIPQQLIYEGTYNSGDFFSPEPCDEEIVLLTHEKQYLDKLLTQRLTAKEQRAIGFPQSPELTTRELIITQGTINCSEAALKMGIALNVAGGTHHAFTDRGEGFCLLNDFAVAANYLLSKQLARKIIIIDLDVHQGNGTASIFQNNSSVFTLSVHGAHNYPFRKEISDLDIPLEDGISDDEYLPVVYDCITDALNHFKPDFAFYLSGVDILETDKFGKLKVSLEGCKARDRFVLTELHNRKIPTTVAMGGGYSEDIKIIVEAHCNTFRIAKELSGY